MIWLLATVNLKLSESEKMERQTSDQFIDFERVDNIAGQSQVIEKNIDNQITRAVISTVNIAENRMHDAFLTAIDIVVIPKVEMAVKSITGSTGQGDE